MNRPKDSTAAPPAARLAGRSITIDAAKLDGMSLQECKNLCQALATLSEVCSGLACQPRFFDSSDRSYNGAGDTLEDLCEWLGSYREAVFKAAKEREATSAREAEERAWCILGTLADWSDGLDDFAVVAAEAVRDRSRAVWHERHPQPAGKAVSL